MAKFSNEDIEQVHIEGCFIILVPFFFFLLRKEWISYKSRLDIIKVDYLKRGSREELHGITCTFIEHLLCSRDHNKEYT